MRIAFLFPGQGAQKVGMGKSFFENDTDSREVFEKAEALLDFPLQATCFEDNTDIHKTEYTQAAMVTTGIAMLQAVKKAGLKAEACAGLSLGEYEALYYAGSLEMEDAIRVVRQRGIFMTEEAPEGGMAAVLGMEGTAVKETIADIKDIWVANYNCPGQVVISGSLQGIEEATLALKEAGAKRILPLNVSGPFHSGLLEKAGERLGAYLEDIVLQDIQVPYVANLNAAYITDKNAIKELLVKQVSGSVRFEQSIENMLEQGIDTFIEIGPGKTLTSFVKKISKDARVYNIENYEDIEIVKNQLLE